MIYDITLPVTSALATWPGDAPYNMRWTARLDDGAAINLGEVAMSVHTGTHADAPFHFRSTGPAIDAVRLEPYIGAARVVHLSGTSSIRVEDLERLDLSKAPRLLIRTGAWTDHARFPDWIPVMDPEVPAWLGSQGAVLVGLDLPSVDALDSKDLPIHHSLAATGIHILESLDLSGVPEGTYDLIALPLRLCGADGSPVRAVLRTL